MPVTVSFRGLCAETGMDKPLRVKVESHDPAPAFRGDAFRVGPALDGVELNRPGVANKLVQNTITTPKADPAPQAPVLARVQPVELALNDLRGDLSSAEAVEHVLNLRKRAQMGKCIERADLFSYSKTTQNNEVELFMDRAYFTKGLLPAIHRAEDSIHLAMLAFDGGEFASYVADKLIEKKRQNPKLKIRIIADDFGSGAILPWSRARRNLNRMRKAGIEVVINSMFFNGLEHRKVLIVDGKEGYFGGACVSDPYFGNDNYWKAYGKIAKNDREAAREAIFNPVPGAAPLFEVTPDMALPDFHDFGIRFKGSTVNDLQAAFIQSWLYQGKDFHRGLSDKEIQTRYFPAENVTGRSGNTTIKLIHGIPKGESEYRQSLLEVVDDAQDTLDIDFSYIMVPEFMEAVKKAATRGVKIRMLLPGEEGIDKKLAWYMVRSFYPALHAAGDIQFYEFKTYTHCKFVVADKCLVFTSTGNPEYNSWEGGFDETALIDSPAFAAEVERQVFGPDLSPDRAALIKPEEFENVGWWKKVLQALSYFIIFLFQWPREPKRRRKNFIVPQPSSSGGVTLATNKRRLRPAKLWFLVREHFANLRASRAEVHPFPGEQAKESSSLQVER